MIGQANKSDYFVRNGDGQPVTDRSSIFPIIAQLSDSEIRFIGTGFFITMNGVFVTAGHVAKEIADLKCPAAVIQFTAGGTFVERPIHKFYVHNGADIAVGVTYQMANDSGEALTNTVLTLSDRMPSIGERLHTYAYPNSTIELRTEDGGKHKAFFNPAFYAGEVEEIYPNGRDSSMMPGPCFQTSIHLHGGSSGGPVFDVSGKVVGINSSSLNIATDVSFISCSQQILDLVLDDVVLPPNPPQRLSIRELARLNHVVVK